MQNQLQASGDFAWAYVIAREMGHHVQQQQGTNAEVTRLQQQNPGDRNELSLRLELQADCYASEPVTLLFPGIRVVVVAVQLPEAHAVGAHHLDFAQELG
jgi:Putative neutral zinc metallopeptidase